MHLAIIGSTNKKGGSTIVSIQEGTSVPVRGADLLLVGGILSVTDNHNSGSAHLGETVRLPASNLVVRHTENKAARPASAVAHHRATVSPAR